MGFADRVLSAFGLQRKRASRALAFSGAVVDRLTSDWIIGPTLIDKDLQVSLPRLRDRSRDLVRNGGYPARFIALEQNHIAGPYGIGLEARMRKARGKYQGALDEPANEAYEAAFDGWACSRYADVARRRTWTQLQRAAVRGWKMDGEAFLRLVLERDNPYGFAVQLLDPMQVDEALNVRPVNGRNEIRMGVELDGNGRRVAYHVLRRHPLETMQPAGHDVIPADQIVHLFTEMFPGQTRGYPALTPVMINLRHLSGYQEAELVAARTAAAKMGFKVRKDPNGDYSVPDAGEVRTTDASPGAIEELEPGEEFQSWDPTHPNQNFPEFTKTVLREIAAGLGVSYSALANDLRDANYSSMKVGRAEEQEQFRADQQQFIDTVCEPVRQAWTSAAMLVGAVTVPNYDVEAITVEWAPRRWISPDPFKDAQTAEIRLRTGLDSRTDILMGEGRDVYATFEHLAEELALAKSFGITVTPAPSAGSPPNGSTTNGTDEPPDAVSDGSARIGSRGADAGSRRRRSTAANLALL